MTWSDDVADKSLALWRGKYAERRGNDDTAGRHRRGIERITTIFDRLIREGILQVPGEFRCSGGELSVFEWFCSWQELGHSYVAFEGQLSLTAKQPNPFGKTEVGYFVKEKP